MLSLKISQDRVPILKKYACKTQSSNFSNFVSASINEVELFKLYILISTQMLQLVFSRSDIIIGIFNYELHASREYNFLTCYIKFSIFFIFTKHHLTQPKGQYQSIKIKGLKWGKPVCSSKLCGVKLKKGNLSLLRKKKKKMEEYIDRVAA